MHTAVHTAVHGYTRPYTAKNRGDGGRTRLPGAFPGSCLSCLALRRGDYFRPLAIALTSSPLVVSPENSQENAPPRPWFFAQAIFEPTVAGVS